MPNAAMAEDAVIRRSNLHRWMKQKGFSAADMARRFYGRYSYWYDLSTNADKPFGEKAARRFEEVADLPRLWLDQPDADLTLIGSAHVAHEAKPTMTPHGWPWTVRLWEATQQLDEEQLAQAEHVLRAHLGLPPAEL